MEKRVSARWSIWDVLGSLVGGFILGAPLSLLAAIGILYVMFPSEIRASGIQPLLERAGNGTLATSTLATLSLAMVAVADLTQVSIAIYLIRFRKKVSFGELGLSLPKARFLWTLPVLVTGAFMLTFLGEIVVSSFFGSQVPTMQCRAVTADFHSEILLGLAEVSLVAPICEEFLFRGVLFGWLKGKMAAPAAVVTSAFVFAVFHLEPALMVPVFFLGIGLAELYRRSGSLLPGILTHGIYNGIVFMLLMSNQSC